MRNEKSHNLIRFMRFFFRRNDKIRVYLEFSN